MTISPTQVENLVGKHSTYGLEPNACYADTMDTSLVYFNLF